jgi:hypothetical protein
MGNEFHATEIEKISVTTNIRTVRCGLSIGFLFFYLKMRLKNFKMRREGEGEFGSRESRVGGFCGDGYQATFLNRLFNPSFSTRGKKRQILR